VITALAALEPELHFSGEGRLAQGRAEIVFHDDAADAIHHSEAHAYRVQLTPTGQCGGLAVVAKSETGFIVEELGGGQGDAGFDWFVVARRPKDHLDRTPHVLPEALPEGLPPLEPAQAPSG
jgi:hypothetical protein